MKRPNRLAPRRSDGWLVEEVDEGGSRYCIYHNINHGLDNRFNMKLEIVEIFGFICRITHVTIIVEFTLSYAVK